MQGISAVPTPGQPITLRVGVFFDGTGNNRYNVLSAAACHAWAAGVDPGDARRRWCRTRGFDGQQAVPDSSYGSELSNIARLYALYRDDAEEVIAPSQGEASLAVYIEGVGTRRGEDDSAYAQGTGRSGSGALARVQQAPALIVQRLALLAQTNPGVTVARVVVDLFGFSRGAAEARHFANDLLKGAGSLLAAQLPVGSTPLAAGFAWQAGRDVQLNFIGLFDTVVAIVEPLAGNFSPANDLYGGLQLGLAKGCARRVIQLVAADEQRVNFALTASDDDIAVPGVHADIGGGYRAVMRERVLLTRPDSCQVSQTLPDAQAPASQRVMQLLDAHGGAWRARGLNPLPWLWNQALPFHRHDDLRSNKRVFAAVLSERDVGGQLCSVYLQIMHAWARRYEVPLAAIDHDPALAVPAELQPIAAKIHAFALGERASLNLDAQEHALLYGRYVHCSAHWGVAENIRDSVLDALYVNRPAEPARRVFENA